MSFPFLFACIDVGHQAHFWEHQKHISCHYLFLYLVLVVLIGCVGSDLQILSLTFLFPFGSLCTMQIAHPFSKSVVGSGLRLAQGKELTTITFQAEFMWPVNTAGSTELNIPPELLFINYSNQAWFMVASCIFFLPTRLLQMTLNLILVLNSLEKS